MNLYPTFQNFILFCSLPPKSQIEWLVDLPNDRSCLTSKVGLRTNDLYDIIYGSRLLFDRFSIEFELSDNAEEAAAQLNWLLVTICGLEDQNVWTRQGLNKSMAWSLVRKLANDFIILNSWNLNVMEIAKGEMFEMCDIDDIYG